MNILNFMFLKFHLSAKLCPQSGVSSSRVSSKSHVLKVACPQSRMSSKSCVLKVVCPQSRVSSKWCPQSGVFKVVSSKWCFQSGVVKVVSPKWSPQCPMVVWLGTVSFTGLVKLDIWERILSSSEKSSKINVTEWWNTYQSIITSECFTLTTWYTWYLLDLLGKMSKSFTNSFSTLALWPQKLKKIEGKILGCPAWQVHTFS